MIKTWGELALYIAIFAASLQSFLPIIGYYYRKNPYLLAVAKPAAFVQCLFVLGAYALLTIAFVTSDFTISYVSANSHELLPLMYRLTAIWGGHEGSILLWILLLNLWTVALALTQKRNTHLPLALAVLGIINLCFLGFLLLTSNPFLAATTLRGGADLNPLLQDPGFVIHPPMLYTGYVGFAVTFALTQAYLLTGELTAAWAKLARMFAIAAWCFLTFGITLGSWWAYRVLGWGGFWFWDPVENASLLPWLSGTALIHVLLIAEKRAAAKSWAVFLTIITFSLSLLGTFLVRSGVLVSAHTFANDPARGIFLLIILAILIVAALMLYIIRMPRLIHPVRFALLSRESGLMINSLFFFIAMLIVLLGTLYPLILDAFHLGTISVGAPYFNVVMTPLVLFVMFIMGFVPFCAWQTHGLHKLWQQTWKKIVLSCLIASILLAYFSHHLDLLTLLTVSLSIWIFLSVFGNLHFLPGMTLAHIGFAVLIIGIILSSTLNEEREVRLRPGDAVSVGPYQFFFIDTNGTSGSNYRGIRAVFDVMKNTRHITSMYPEKRIYTVREMVMTKVDIHPGIFRDLYIALGEPLENNYWSVRLYYKPFMRWVWLGGLLMIFGGILALLQRHTREIIIK